MESRKMALMDLFSGQQWRSRHREQTYGHGEGEERVRCLERVTGMLPLPYVNRQPTEIRCMTQGTQTEAL